MFEAEAIRIRDILLAHGAVSPLLNLGSSTGEFRRTAKPHIQRELFGPLAAAGVAVVHSDLKQADGVDLAGDILDPAVLRDLKARGFRCVLCANLLEHVRDRARGRGGVRGDRRPGRADPRHGAVELPLSCRSDRYRLPALAGRARRPVQAKRAAARRGGCGPDLWRGSQGARLDGLAGDRRARCCSPCSPSRGRRASPRGSIAGAGIAGPTKSRSLLVQVAPSG